MLLYLEGVASSKEIEQHLLACDAAFSPPLSATVDISIYARKLAEKSVRFEAWGGGVLAGLVAIYCNDEMRRIAFISNVSVLEEWRGKGVAKRLLQSGLTHAKNAGFAMASLEVELQNAAAIALYRSLGFSFHGAGGQRVTMSLAL